MLFLNVFILNKNNESVTRELGHTDEAPGSIRSLLAGIWIGHLLGAGPGLATLTHCSG